MTARYFFPTFNLLRTDDNEAAGFETEIGEVTQGSGSTFCIKVSRKKQQESYPPFNFLLRTISDGKGRKILWDSRDENRPDLLFFLTRVNYREEEGLLVVAFVERGPGGKVVEIRTLNDITDEDDDCLKRHALLKGLAADSLDLDAEFSPMEKVVLRDVRQNSAIDDSRGERQRRRDEIRDRVMIRPTITVLKKDGIGNRYGVPVTLDEWHSLRHGTFVILVSSYNEETHEVGEALEAFEVIKLQGKHPQKGNPCEVTSRSREEILAEAPQPVAEAVVKINGKYRPVTVFESVEALGSACGLTINGNALASAKDAPSEADTVMVYSATSNGLQEEGYHKLIGA